MQDRPYFFTLAGTDGSGKTTTLKLLRDSSDSLGRPVVFLDKKDSVGTECYADSHLASLRDLIWGHPKDAPVHLLGEMHWMHLQAAWFHALGHYRIRPTLKSGKSVFMDGWHHKFLARVDLAPSLDYRQVSGFFEGVVEPDCVVLLDVEPEVALARKRSFTEVEGGNFRGESRATWESFVDHQGALREKLRQMASLRNWPVVSVAHKSKEQVCSEVLDAIAKWERDYSQRG